MGVRGNGVNSLLVLLGLNAGMSEAYEKFLLWLELGWVEHHISTRLYKY